MGNDIYGNHEHYKETGLVLDFFGSQTDCSCMKIHEWNGKKLQLIKVW